eukprot:CAMPEP_0180712782 /NCGR_PEP_ID=MMETSP1038_2-20121128/11549_1 /TAXON_ID=632150 /ORGANISM="Azadinium spinosum, Strain 3D9" /LENGTH=52 /DNA_ID=CAMNT_0022745057 /DNA_START=37 /DNA_END=192 /DNA_ORIENTATION=-
MGVQRSGALSHRAGEHQGSGVLNQRAGECNGAETLATEQRGTRERSPEPQCG